MTTTTYTICTLCKNFFLTYHKEDIKCPNCGSEKQEYFTPIELDSNSDLYSPSAYEVIQTIKKDLSKIFNVSSQNKTMKFKVESSDLLTVEKDVIDKIKGLGK